VKPGLTWLAIVLSALLFGVGHLPAASYLIGSLNGPIVLFVIGLNATFGVLFGAVLATRLGGGDGRPCRDARGELPRHTNGAKVWADPNQRAKRADNRLVVHDLRQVVRNIGRSPRAALVIVLSLALGTGANAAVYSAVDALLFRAPAGVGDRFGLVDIYTSQFNGGTYGESSDADVRSFSEASELAGVALLEDRNQASVAAGPASALARVAAVSDGFWSVLG
jgi:hypothetical protein